MAKGIRTTNRQQIQEVPYGMLVWQLPDGEFITDDEGNFMHVFCSNQDPKILAAAIRALRDAARGLGHREGKVVFWAGRRPIDDEELAHQFARQEAGLVPDPLDIAAIKEEAAALRQQNG